MERSEFQDKLKLLSEMARQKGNCLSMEEVQAFLGELSLKEEQLKLVYEYLAASEITVTGYVPEQREEGAAYTREELNFLNTYQKELQRLVPMEPKELEELLQQVEQEDKLAKAQATEQLLGSVLEQAKEFHGRGLPLEDLVQEGNVGLMLCLENLAFRENGMTRAAYVEQEIRRAIQEALEEAVSARRQGNQIADKVNHLSDNILKLTEELERQVTLEELSAFLDMSMEEIADILKLAGDGVELAKDTGNKTYMEKG